MNESSHQKRSALTRIIVLVSALAFSFLSVTWVSSGYEFVVESPQVDLSTLPMEFDSWRGDDVEIQAETLGVLRAHSYIQRRYADVIGRQVSLHAAIWGSIQEVRAAAPHHPDVCYPAAGWEIMERRHVDLDTADGAVPMELIHFQRLGESVVTAHWYRMGDTYFTTAHEGRSKFLALWGSSSWPCTEKYLLQTAQPSIDAAEPLLSRFASELIATMDGAL